MAKGFRVCKVCGKQYEYCKTEVPVGTNRWQDVACCIEHATEYFKEIAISRGELVEEKSKPTVVAKKEVATVEKKVEKDLKDKGSDKSFDTDFKDDKK